MYFYTNNGPVNPIPHPGQREVIQDDSWGFAIKKDGTTGITASLPDFSYIGETVTVLATDCRFPLNTDAESHGDSDDRADMVCRTDGGDVLFLCSRIAF